MAKTPKPELFLSHDVEANGDSPILNAMLAFAFACMNIDKQLIATFARNLIEPAGTVPNPETMKWWMGTAERRSAYAASRVNTIPAQQAMDEFRAWCEDMKRAHQLVPAAWPCGYDYMWINAYATTFSNGAQFPENPLGNACIDGKTFAFGRNPHARYREMSKKTYPRHWFDDLPHTHVAEDDAIEQACLLVNAVREARGLPHIAGYQDLRA